MIIARAPYRISFLGGGTDFPLWYREHNGAVISATIDKYCYIQARRLPPFFEHKHRIVYSQIELTNSVDNIGHPSVRETLKFLNVTDGIEIHHTGDLPARTGIGTSSAFTVALLHAASILQGRKVSKAALASDAIHIEQDLIGEAVGSQDQTASAFGGLNRIDFDNSGIRVKNLATSTLEGSLLLFFTGFQRNATDIEKEKLRRLKDNHSAFEELYQLVAEGERALNNLPEFGKLLHEGWMLKRSMAPNTSSEYIDFLYQKGLNADALGGKLLGAGGGGFLLFLVEPDTQNRVKEAMGNLLQVPFKFESKGSEVIFNNGQ